MADWQDDLQSRVNRAYLIFELVDCSRTDDFDALKAEVILFNQVCTFLTEGKMLPLPERKAA
jgi:hypothetical protein